MTKQEAIDFLGTPSELARFLGRSRSTVSEWPQRLPSSVQFELQVKTNGQLIVDPELLNSDKGRAA